MIQKMTKNVIGGLPTFSNYLDMWLFLYHGEEKDIKYENDLSWRSKILINNLYTIIQAISALWRNEELKRCSGKVEQHFYSWETHNRQIHELSHQNQCNRGWEIQYLG